MPGPKTIKEELIQALEEITQKANAERPQPLTKQEFQILLISSLLEEEGQ